MHRRKVWICRQCFILCLQVLQEAVSWICYGPKILEGDYRPGFFMKHFIKDMKLALIESNISGLDLNVLSQVLAEYEELQAEGLGDEGTQALFKLYTQEKADE